jgi:hypothetical protein
MNKLPSPASFVLTGLVVVLMVIVGIIVFFKKEVIPEPVVTPIVTSTDCTNGLTKTNAIGNTFTCIDGKWIYTGNVSDIKG